MGALVCVFVFYKGGTEVGSTAAGPALPATPQGINRHIPALSSGQ